MLYLLLSSVADSLALSSIPPTMPVGQCIPESRRPMTMQAENAVRRFHPRSPLRAAAQNPMPIMADGVTRFSKCCAARTDSSGVSSSSSITSSSPARYRLISSATSSRRPMTAP